MESLDQFRRLEVHEKVRNVFVMSLRLRDHHVLHNIASVLITFFSISLGFAHFFRSYFVLSKLLELRNFIKQLFHSRLMDMRLLIANSYPTRAHGMMGPLQVSDHMVQKPPHWNANCALGHLINEAR